MEILIIPGLGGSGEQHWQSRWAEKYKQAVKLEQDDWNAPQLGDWLHTLQAGVQKAGAPLVLVAHSLGVALVAHWASRYATGIIKGALLVAPADVDSPEYTPPAVRNFAPMPLSRLPFPSLVVASNNDRYIHPARAQLFAARWGSRFIDIGNCGHINADSDLGDWEEGQRLLGELMAMPGA